MSGAALGEGCSGGGLGTERDGLRGPRKDWIVVQCTGICKNCMQDTGENRDLHLLLETRSPE